MKLSRGGFLIYLALVVTTVLVFLVLGGHDVARLTLDMGRSVALEAVCFHAADGGLERGLARVRKVFSPFGMQYSFEAGKNRHLTVSVEARRSASGDLLDIQAAAFVIQGGKIVAIRRLERTGVRQATGRTGCGRFREIS